MLNLFKKYRNNRKQICFYQSLISKNDLCFDIGANVGKKSKIMLQLGARVIAFEPQTSCISELNKISNNRFRYVKTAVGSENGMAELNLANHSEVATLSQKFIDCFETEQVKWDRKEQVEVQTIDSLIEEYGIPQYCKVDVEGYEWNILSTLSHMIPIIEFEFTGGFLNEAIRIINLFDNSRYTFNFNLHEKPKFEGDWMSRSRLIAKIKALQLDKLHGNVFVKLISE